MSKASNNWMFLLNSIIQVLISAQKSCNCLAAVDEAAQKAPQKPTVCPVKFQIFTGPHRRCHSDFKLCLSNSNPPPVNFFLVSFKKQTDLNVFMFCTILKKHRLKGGSRLHQHLLCSIVLVPTIWVHVIDLKPIYKVSSHPFVLSILVLDGSGGGIHRWIGGMAPLFWKVLKFLWNPLTLLRLFFFPKFQK